MLAQFDQEWRGARSLIALDQQWHSVDACISIGERVAGLINCPPTHQGSGFAEAVMTLCDLVERDGALRAVRGRELLYHNRQHVHDVLRAADLLLGVRAYPFEPSTIWSIILAMVGHDLGHEGLPNRYPRQLERRSWSLIKPCLQTAQLELPHMRMIRSIILATDPLFYGTLVRKRPARSVMQAVHLAVDSDLFASLLPSVGFKLGARLGEEQMAVGLDKAAGFRTLAGRAMFLKSAPLLSPAIQQIGMVSLVQAQCRVIDRMDPIERSRPWSPQWAQDFRDRVVEVLERG